MATNEVFRQANNLQVACTDPTTPASGDPVRYGQRPGVAETAEDAAGLASVTFEGEHNLSVKGVDGSGNHAIAEGDIVYYVDADTPKLSAKATGVRYGYAGAAVGSGLTATIPVIVGY